MSAAALIVRNAAGTIAQTIESVRPFVDEVCVYLAGESSDGTPELLGRLAAEPGPPLRVEQGEWRYGDWSREQSFLMVSEAVRWIVWLDDDVLLGGENLRRVIAEAEPLGTPWIMVDYDYLDLPDGTTNVTRRARIARRGACRWEGAAHEDLVAVGPYTSVTRSANVDPRTLSVRHLRREPRPAGHYLEQIRAAVELGTSRTPNAYLLLGKELLELGRAEEAADALTRYVAERHYLLAGGELAWGRGEALERLVEAHDRLGDAPTVAKWQAELAAYRAAVEEHLAALRSPRRAPKVGRNDPCWCGSGRKAKKCCGVAVAT